MKVNTKELKSALDKCGVVVKRKVSATVLEDSVWLFADKDIVLKACDLDSYIGVKVGVSDEALTGGLPYRAFSKFLNKPDGEVMLVKNAGDNTLTATRRLLGEATFTIFDAKDFPPIPVIQPTKELDAKLLCYALSLVVKGCATDESRPVLAGVSIKENELATADGFRLYVYHHNDLNFGLGDKQVILPGESARKIIKLFSKSGKVKVGFGYDNAVFDDGTAAFICHLTLGAYPKYQQLVPDNFPCRAAFSVPLMLDRLNMVFDDAINGITRFMFSEALKVCYIQAGSEDMARYKLEIPVRVSIDGKIAINKKFFIDAIKPFSLCEMSLSNPSSPAKFTGDIEGLTVVVMPMFVQW